MKNMAIAFVVLVLVTLACGSSSTGVKVGESTSGAPASAPSQLYKIGDVVQLGDQTIVLNSADIQGNKVTADFTVENKGSSEMTVSSLFCCTAKDNEGTKLVMDLICVPGLDGNVLPGDELKGDLCWKGTTKTPIKIYYEAPLYSKGVVVWQVP